MALAVMFALVAGVASLAVAQGKPPSSGDKALAVLKGVSNTVEAVTSMVGSLADAAILQLKTQLGARPWTCRCKATRPP